MRLPPDIRERFRAHGRDGGRKRAAGSSPEARTALARRAALQRWIRTRFGAPRFQDLGLPGAAIVDDGLAALADGRETLESLAVSEAAPRLRREGVPIPDTVFSDPDVKLYRLLECGGVELAHARYLACLRQIVSFADACAAHRTKGGRRA